MNQNQSRLQTVLALSCALASSPSFAQTRNQADIRLATLSPVELSMVAPLLEHGIVSLVEFADDNTLPAIVIAADVAAPPNVVASVLGNPTNYASFMPALDSVEITAESGDQTSYTSTWRAAVFTLRGQNLMQRFCPPADHPERGYRFVFRSTGGDLGVGRNVWRIFPRGTGHSLVISSSRMDFRDANYIARQLSAGGAAVNRSINIAMAFSVFVRTRSESERVVGASHVHVADTLVRPAIDPARFENLLLRGDLMWVDTSDGSDLGTVMVLGRMHNSLEDVRHMILDPGGFAQGLLQGAHATTTQQDEQGSEFDWGINLPLVGTSGHMRMRAEDDGLIHLNATSGAMEGATWRFETIPRDYGTLVMTWGHFDLSNGLWLVRLVTDTDIAFRPGLSLAAQLMMVRGLRGRLLLAG